MNKRHPELLIPASSLEVLKTAVVFGADAVYIGGEAFGLRAKAKNFSREDMKAGIDFAHAHGARVHVTVNILAHNDDLNGVREYLYELSVLVEFRSEEGGLRQGAVLKRDSGDSGAYPKGDGDRELYPWRYVYFLFRKVSSE